MIPKIIHYCWFGGKSKPELVEKCIASWRKCCPDWEIWEWNESNYDVWGHPYMAAAYEEKKWAFVSDVARLDIISRYGGIYLDTDVEIFASDPFAPYLNYDGLFVFETERVIQTGMCMGASEGNALINKLLMPYENTVYSKDTATVNSVMNKPVFLEAFPGLKWNGRTQFFGSTCIVGCDEYGRIMKHHGTRSWCDDLPEYKISGFWGIKKVFRNPAIFEFMEQRKWLRKLIPVYTFAVYDFLDLGPIYYIKRIAMKLRRNKL